MYISLRTGNSKVTFQLPQPEWLGYWKLKLLENEERTDTYMHVQKSWGQVGSLHFDEVVSAINNQNPQHIHYLQHSG